MQHRSRQIRRLLVANRGELVVRIARTAQGLGVRCLALAPDDEANSWWASQADEIVPLLGTYLDADAVITAARRADADAIHPGYGFLAESPAFAESVVAAGIAWVGPGASAMRAVGDKAAGRRLATTVGVPVLPGYDGDLQNDAVLHAEATRIGFPVLVKPSAGGGGKGMHVAHKAADLGEALARGRREAVSAFGDPRLILERYIGRPRHVEVQFLADIHGDAVHLGERDCSLQRRHQKVIEESPSPAVNEALRDKLGEAALTLARAAGYVGAGTAEFLIDEAGAFFFLEVNARLQVEHPVTEMVVGRDLVEDQLRISAGEPLGFSQADVTSSGHAVEARLYAEDPWAGFLPATGKVRGVRWPRGPGIRVDPGIGAGDEVGTRYDPLLAKVLAVGSDRNEAIDRLVSALRETSVAGVTTNRGFLMHLLSEPEVRAGQARTDTIDRTWRPQENGPDDGLFGAAAAVLSRPPGDSTVDVGFRLNAPTRLMVRLGEQERPAMPDEAALGGLGWTTEGELVLLDADGRAFEAQLAPPPSVEAAISHAQREAGTVAAVTAPMPGGVLAIRVSEGEAVQAGQTLILLEAMKMENAVTAPAAATVSRVLVRAGQQVQRGDPLVELS